MFWRLLRARSVFLICLGLFLPSIAYAVFDISDPTSGAHYGYNVTIPMDGDCDNTIDEIDVGFGYFDGKNYYVDNVSTLFLNVGQVRWTYFIESVKDQHEALGGVYFVQAAEYSNGLKVGSLQRTDITCP